MSGFVKKQKKYATWSIKKCDPMDRTFYSIRCNILVTLVTVDTVSVTVSKFILSSRTSGNDFDIEV